MLFFCNLVNKNEHLTFYFFTASITTNGTDNLKKPSIPALSFILYSKLLKIFDCSSDGIIFLNPVKLKNLESYFSIRLKKLTL